MSLRLLVIASLVFASAAPAAAGPILADTFYEFSFTNAFVPAAGCDPADSLGGFCIPSSGTPTQFADGAPWTFTADAGGATLTVTDAFLSGDRFQIFDFGVSIGFTSAFVADVDCGDDPVPCLADPGISHGVFALAAGAHSITLWPTESVGGGSGYFIVEGGVADPGALVPEPATFGLFAGGLGLVFRRVRRQASNRRVRS